MTESARRSFGIFACHPQKHAQITALQIPKDLKAFGKAPVAQLDRALDYGSGGLGFESLRVCHFSVQEKLNISRRDENAVRAEVSVDRRSAAKPIPTGVPLEFPVPIWPFILPSANSHRPEVTDQTLGVVCSIQGNG